MTSLHKFHHVMCLAVAVMVVAIMVVAVTVVAIMVIVCGRYCRTPNTQQHIQLVFVISSQGENQ